jgi:isoleucyl-tRNA synthetase
MPFFAEELYQNLVVSIDPAPIDINEKSGNKTRTIHKNTHINRCGVDPDAPESVHLTNFPEPQANLRNTALETETELVRELISLGLAARKSAEIKVRQPLTTGVILGLSDEQQKIVGKYNSIFQEELNIRNITFAEKDKVLPGNFVMSKDETNMNQYHFYIDTTLTKELEHEGLARELVHKIQNLRKASGFDVVDRIQIYYEVTPKLAQAIKAYNNYIAQELLAEKIAPLSEAKSVDIKKALTINSESATISLRRIKKAQ